MLAGDLVGRCPDLYIAVLVFVFAGVLFQSVVGLPDLLPVSGWRGIFGAIRGRGEGQKYSQNRKASFPMHHLQNPAK